DEPVWPVDLIKSPVRELGTRATDTSGKIGHEAGHDNYGNMAKFDPQVREGKLDEAAEKAIRAAQASQKFVTQDQFGRLGENDTSARDIGAAHVYEKSLAQDQFGRLGEIDTGARDNKLSDIADRALKHGEDKLGVDLTKPIELPTGGIDPQEVLLNNVARKAEKIDPAEREDFINKSVTPTRFMNGVMTADQLLGQSGRMGVTIPGQGTFNLDEFLVNVAMQADQRPPSQILADAQSQFQGQPARPEIDAQIKGNIAQILGRNADAQVPAADGSKISLREAAEKISEATRTVKFNTYDKPLPKSITMKDILVGISKGWADETFADWNAGARSGQSAAPYFQALRKDGKLSKGTVMGQELRSEENPLGVEVHPVDKLRPQFIAALVRALAQPRGKYIEADKMLVDYADALEKYGKD